MSKIQIHSRVVKLPYDKGYVVSVNGIFRRITGLQIYPSHPLAEKKKDRPFFTYDIDKYYGRLFRFRFEVTTECLGVISNLDRVVSVRGYLLALDNDDRVINAVYPLENNGIPRVAVQHIGYKYSTARKKIWEAKE